MALPSRAPWVHPLLWLMAGALPAAAQVAPPAAADDPVPGAVAVPTVDVQGSAPSQVGYQPLRATVGAGTEARILDIPQSVVVVPSRVLRDQAASTLDEALANVSGIAQTNTLGGTQDAVIRRGFGDNRDGGILIDGLRTALPRSFNAATDYVEVLKGPSATLYGILDPGGLVNVVTRRPQLTQAGSITGRLSSFGGGSTGFDLTGPLGTGGFAYRLIGEYENQSYWRDFGSIRQSMIAPSFGWYGPDTTAEFSYWHVDYDVPFDRGTIFDTRRGQFVDIPRGRRLDERYNITSGDSDLAAWHLGQRLNQDWRVDLRYTYSINNYSDNQARVTAYDSATGIATRRADATQSSTIFNHAMRADVNGQVRLLGLRNNLLFGTSYDYSSTRRSNLIRGTVNQRFNIFDPVYGRLAPSTNVVASDSDQTERLEAWSVYAQDSVHLNDQWIAVAGLRFQHYDQFAGRGRPFNVNTNATGGRLTPRLGLVYQPRPDLSLFVNYSQSFKPNSNIASYIGSQPPETGESWEAGVKAELLEGVTLTAAVFNIQKQNVLYSVTTGGVTSTYTAGRVRSSGFELDLAGRITERLSGIASFAVTDAIVVEDPSVQGKRLPNVPRTTASAFLTYDFGPVLGGEGLSVGGGVRHEGRRAGDAANSFFLPSYAVADAFMAYDFRLDRTLLRAQVNVKNIFDRTYYTSSIGSNNLGVAYGEPLEAVASLTARF
ncbi:iron complex outermembrane recepter protein [Roseomonas rosea]|jgi:iron complex outermembrane recepter protein|uniref:Iron complex outermembrane recepter protein n=1 Tax=Muricoccus roseus TaxID=198092 RepID=A0A1M6DEL4_9PROT|nr:TonB-dependent siderophore receptor [Roseomonas rosea]SHI71501.1 iron complex outermembrane recepter protein [Roseomonas rosea]